MENTKTLNQTIGIIGDNIKIQRQTAKLTQSELADKCGMSRVYLGQIERGDVNPSIKQLEMIATGLNKSLKITIYPDERE